MSLLGRLSLQEGRIRPDGNTSAAIFGDGEKWHLVVFQAPTLEFQKARQGSKRFSLFFKRGTKIWSLKTWGLQRFQIV